MNQDMSTIKAEALSTEEIIAQTFLTVACLTPEQFGMVKLYLAIIRRFEQGETHESAVAPLDAESIAAEIGQYIKDNAVMQSGDTPKKAVSPEPLVKVTPTPPLASIQKKTIAPEVTRFAEYIAANGISQSRAAADIGIKAGSINNILTGKYSASQQVRDAMMAYINSRKTCSPSPTAPRTLPANPTPAAAND